MVLKEAKTEEYSDLGLMYKLYKVLQNWYLFKCAMTEASKNSKSTQHQATKRGKLCTTTGQLGIQVKIEKRGYYVHINLRFNCGISTSNCQYKTARRVIRVWISAWYTDYWNIIAKYKHKKLQKS